VDGRVATEAGADEATVGAIASEDFDETGTLAGLGTTAEAETLPGPFWFEAVG